MRTTQPDKLEEYRSAKKQRTQAPLDNMYAGELPPVEEIYGLLDDGEQAEADKLLAQWLAESNRPFTLSEHSGFIKLATFLMRVARGRKWKIPTRTAVARTVAELATQYRASLRARVRDECTSFSATTDIWSDRAMRSYLALTIHYLDENFVMNDWTLEVEPIPGKHDAPAIASALRDAFSRWGLNDKECVRLVRDDASNGRAAANQLGLTSFVCVAHSLHLVVSGAMIKKKKNMNLSDATPSSTNTIVGRAEFGAVGQKLLQPTPMQWFAIQCLVRLLEPFAAAVEHLSGSHYPTFAVAYPMLRYIRSQLRDETIFDELVTSEQRTSVTDVVVPNTHGVREAMLELFDERFRSLDSTIVWVSCLDPRLSDMQHLDEQEKVIVRDCAIRAAMETVRGMDPSEVEPVPAVPPTPEKVKSKLHASVYGQTCWSYGYNKCENRAEYFVDSLPALRTRV